MDSLTVAVPDFNASLHIINDLSGGLNSSSDVSISFDVTIDSCAIIELAL